ncbi:MAG TPA: ATP-binding protein [Planctomycetota bacterium]|nr:ATP-binding protein [Planctomycetota bacterium]
MNPNYISLDRTGRDSRESEGSTPNRFGAKGDPISRASGDSLETAPRDTSAASGPLDSLPDNAAWSQSQRESAFHQERLRGLTAELLRVEERVRRRLSSEFHDGLDRTILLIRMKLAALRRSTDPRLADSVLEIERLLEQADKSARGIAQELEPPSLHEQGLEAAIKELAAEVGARHGVKIVVGDDGRPKPTEAKAREALFRSMRELFINAAERARAQRIRVSLERAERNIRVTVEDDGIGMRTNAEASDDYGLFTIRERLSHVGGSMKIESVPEHGTTVCLCAPLAADRATNTKANP